MSNSETIKTSILLSKYRNSRKANHLKVEVIDIGLAEKIVELVGFLAYNR